jgi:hypothetical protein
MTNKASDKKAEDVAAVLAAIAAMPEHDRVVSRRLHVIITTNAPELFPRTWYGMPAYHDGKKIVCFFRSGAKFGERYMTLGFNDVAKLDEGNMWPVNFAITDLSEAVEAELTAIVKKAVR